MVKTGIKFRKPDGRVACLSCHELPDGDITCFHFGCVVTKECCEECKYGNLKAKTKMKCPSEKACSFKRFDPQEGMLCDIDKLPEHISAICERRWNILVLKKSEKVLGKTK